MTYTVEKKQVGRFEVVLWHDEYMNWQDVLCDEPILVFSKYRGGTHVLFDNSKTVSQDFDVLSCVEDGDWMEAIWQVDGLADVETLEDGRVRVDSEWFKRPRYFKTLESAAKRTVLESCGLDLEDVQVQRFSTQDAEVYMAWSKSELDKYAGIKDAKAPLETVRYFLDGDVYGFTIEDADGDVLDSCGGYIGDWQDVMAEAEAEAGHFEADALKQDAEVLEASRADLYADA